VRESPNTGELNTGGDEADRERTRRALQANCYDPAAGTLLDLVREMEFHVEILLKYYI
jgi:hypothetical protein